MPIGKFTKFSQDLFIIRKLNIRDILNRTTVSISVTPQESKTSFYFYLIKKIEKKR